MTATFALFLGALAAAVACDTWLGAELLRPKTARFEQLKSSLRSTIGVLDGARISFPIKCAVILLFLIVLHFWMLASYDEITSGIAIGLLIRNWPITIGLFISVFVISLWSFSQSLFFIKLANRLTTPLGMIYLFISDLLLSTFIFVFGLTFYFMVLDSLIPHENEFSASILVTESCKEDCELNASNYIDDGGLRRLIYRLRLPNDIADVPSVFALDDHIASAELEEIKMDDLLDEDKTYLQSVNAEPKYLIKFKFDLSSYEVSKWATFTYILKKQMDEIWRHLRFSFQYYSFQQYKYGKYEIRELGFFSNLEELMASDAISEIVPDPDLRRKLINLASDADSLSQFEQGDSIDSKDVEAFFVLTSFQFTKWYLLDRIATRDYFKDFKNSDYRAFLEDPRDLFVYGEQAVRPYFLPITTFWLASISFSSMFILFLLARFLLNVLEYVEFKRTSIVSRFPLTVVTATLFPVVAVIERFFLSV